MVYKKKKNKTRPNLLVFLCLPTMKTIPFCLSLNMLDSQNGKKRFFFPLYPERAANSRCFCMKRCYLLAPQLHLLTCKTTTSHQLKSLVSLDALTRNG